MFSGLGEQIQELRGQKCPSAAPQGAGQVTCGCVASAKACSAYVFKNVSHYAKNASGLT